MRFAKRFVYVALATVHIVVLASGLDTRSLLIVRGDGVQIHIEVEIAATAEQRMRGLMDRSYIAPRSGMWFDFEVSSRVTMWMKGTSISLDMLFVDETGAIIYMQKATEPQSLKRIEAPTPVRYVLELNAGEAQTYAITVGDRVVIGAQ